MSEKRELRESSELDEKTAALWEEFCELSRDVLSTYGLKDIATTEWFDQQGHDSIRFGVRYELGYNSIGPALVKLATILRSSEGKRLRQELAQFVDPLVSSLESEVWKHGVARLPEEMCSKVGIKKP